MSKTITAFISQPMFGRTDDDILAEREKAKEAIREHFSQKEVTFLDTMNYDDIPEGSGRLVYLGRSIQQLDKADLVYFCRGWEQLANGCRIEKEVCQLYGIPYFLEDEI